MALRIHLNLLHEAAAMLLRHRGRSLVLLACLAGMLLPLITAAAVAEGVRLQAAESLAAGGDVIVTRGQFGRNGPVELALAERLAALHGVERVTPRIVGRAVLGSETVVVVGIDGAAEDAGEGQAVLGRALARRLALSPGDELRFSIAPEVPLTVAGLLEPESSLWAQSMVRLSFSDAVRLFRQPGLATELLLHCRPGLGERVAEEIAGPRFWDKSPPLRIQTRRMLSLVLERGYTMQGGVFSALYLAAMGLSLPVLALLAGFGRGARQREIGIMKATGWQTLEVLELAALEHLLLALAGAALALGLAMAWLRLGNGIGIAPLCISGAGWWPDFPLPARFSPLPALLALVFSLALTMVGTIPATWRLAVTPPAAILE